MKKLFLLIIKFIPVIQMAGMLFNNILCYKDINININFILDYIFGHSVINTILLIVCSYDASDETTFRRWVATMIGNGNPIDWYEII